MTLRISRIPRAGGIAPYWGFLIYKLGGAWRFMIGLYWYELKVLN